ncbi:hypothetical protein JOD43_002276 [Pullulanibacillus pueri]|uniref:Uncharacterized protein n=1 Tax=Pullulanibacillus pueri TaxID=1437324 RepID=A0A8J2ZVE3_9BACL|nr:hypothetical protein [Pullulanibacillus pueri]MBM7682103.1 hypothetical protein [Pullulanibacillus pueri]GGH79969.1 hypothetical protein GCM10007096_15680 [Pullulanibacillus pueri]
MTAWLTSLSSCPNRGPRKVFFTYWGDIDVGRVSVRRTGCASFDVVTLTEWLMLLAFTQLMPVFQILKKNGHQGAFLMPVFQILKKNGHQGAFLMPVFQILEKNGRQDTFLMPVFQILKKNGHQGAFLKPVFQILEKNGHQDTSLMPVFSSVSV